MLTERQKRVLDYIAGRLKDGYSPTIREIAEHFGFSSTGTVRDYIKALERKGYISRKRKIARGIRINKPLSSIKVIGNIHAGDPKLALQDEIGNLPLDFGLDYGRELFALRVKGDSMKDAGILEGDYVIVESGVFEIGDIVIAVIGEEATVKRLVRKGNELFLKPENSSYRAIPFNEETSILGRVIRVVRYLK